MHRSRLSVLVILAAAVAACSKNDAAEGTDLLSQDRALVARLEVDQETRQPTLPATCGRVALAAQPALASQQQASELTRQARDAQIQGNVKEARALLLRASELDGTNKTTAYQLGRTSEALGDRTAAITAYCRYLALTPTTPEAVEAHQRLSQLSRPVTGVAAGSVVDTTSTVSRAPVAKVATATPAPARRVTRERVRAEPRVVASAPVERPAPAQRSAPAVSRERDARSATVAAGGADVSPTTSDPVSTPRPVDTTTTPAGEDVVASAGAEPAVQAPTVEEPPSTAPRTTRRGPSRAQSAGIGAGMGAIIGAATGRSVKSAVIGAAAGGILGTVMGSRMGPVGRGITPYASGGR